MLHGRWHHAAPHERESGRLEDHLSHMPCGGFRTILTQERGVVAHCAIVVKRKRGESRALKRRARQDIFRVALLHAESRTHAERAALVVSVCLFSARMAAARL